MALTLFHREVIPLPIKIFYTLFVAVLMPVYWAHFDPTHFLWASDIALFAMLIALWSEDRLLTSMVAVAVAVLLPELAWNLDFFTRFITRRGLTGLDATAYMFNPAQPLWLWGCRCSTCSCRCCCYEWFTGSAMSVAPCSPRRCCAGWCCPSLTCSQTRPGTSIGYLDGVGSRRPGCPLRCT